MHQNTAWRTTGSAWENFWVPVASSAASSRALALTASTMSLRWESPVVGDRGARAAAGHNLNRLWNFFFMAFFDPELDNGRYPALLMAGSD